MRLKIVLPNTTRNYKVLRILFAFFISCSWFQPGHAQFCNVDSEIIITNVTQDAPMDSVDCQGGDLLEICFKVNDYLPTSLEDDNYFHSLIPDFGECIVPVSVLPSGEPGVYTLPFTNYMGTPGDWVWFEEGMVQYNDILNGYLPPFSEVGAGWFYINSWGCFGQPFEPNPNESRGDPDPNPQTQWEVCFLAEAICVEIGNPIDCELSFKTFSEGETGCGFGDQCINDEPWTYNFELNCCEQPVITITESEYTVCSGDLFELPITSNMDPETTFSWVVNPGTYGATSGSGSLISDALTNPGCDPVTETYYITPVCAFGCVGEIFVITVTILPEFEMNLGPDLVICEFETVTIFPQITCTGDFIYQWSTGETTESITVGPGFYSLTLTDVNGCVVRSSSVFIDGYMDYIMASIEAPNGVEVCEGDPISLVAEAMPAYLAPFQYTWSTGEIDQSIIPTSSGNYWVYIYSWDLCSIEGFASIDVVINENPEVEVFASATNVCPGTTISITAQSTTGSYGGCVWNNGSTEPELIVVPNIGVTTYSVVITDENGCTGEGSIAITVEEELPSPFIDCVVTENSVEFSWNPIPGASSYLVNDQEQTGTTILFDGLSPNETVDVTVEAIAANGCGNSFAESSCTTINCPTLNVQISDVDLLCQEDVTIELQASEPGGQWYGAGIIDPIFGLFNPSFANPGNNTIIYVISNNLCEYTTTTEIEVEEALEEVMITCNSTVDAVSFSWESIPNANGYLVNGVLQSATSFMVNNLLPNQGASITVEAISSGLCPNTVAQAYCETEDCDPVSLSISPVASLCQQGGSIQLQANEQGVTWSGSGITNQNSGDFDPSAAEIGTNIIICTMLNGACEYTASLEIEVEESLSSPTIICNSTVDEVSFSWTPVDGATSYLVNGVEQNGTTYQANNLQPNQEVFISVEAVSSGVCGNAIAESSCIAQDCAQVNLAISPVSNLCQEDGSIQLQATEQNVVWSGSGITNADAGDFDPAVANVGTNTIICTWTNGACEYSTSLEIEVEAALATPVINCNSTVDEVSFSWTPIDGATSYLVNGVEQNGTTYQANNLQPNQEVSISVVAINNGVCGDAFAESSCVTQDCAQVNLAISPVSNLCQEDGSIQLQATEQGVVWSGAGITSADSGDFDPASANVGTNTVVCSWTNGACEYTSSLEIEVEAALATPIINCNSTVDEVSFSWTAVDGATSYLVNGVEQNGTTYQANNLLPNQEVNISVVAINNGVCGNTTAESSCVAQDCAQVNLAISPVSNLCQEDGSIQLQSTEQNVVWSGSGITNADAGDFDPAVANVGTNTIICTWTNGACEYTSSLEIEVEAALATPVINCNSTVDEVSFSWTPVDGATSYLVNGVEQNGTTYQANNLLPNQEVNISVVAINNGVCGNTFAESSCVAQDCAQVNLAISPVSNLCQEDGSIQLQATEQGVVWSGPGITNADLGDFDPAVANVGTNTIICTWTNGACEYSTSLEIEVEAALATPVINCNSTVDEVSFSWTAVDGATSYLVNGVEQNGTTYQANNLLPNEEVTISVVAINNGVCGNSMAQSSCMTTDCAIVNMLIAPLPDICGNELPNGLIELEVEVLGSNLPGLWSGNGVVDAVNGLFDPTAADLINGENEISYTITNGYCEFSESTTVSVFEALETEVVQIGALDCSGTAPILVSPEQQNVNYVWVTPSGNQMNGTQIEALEEGGYTLLITSNLNGCTASKFISLITDTAPPIIALTAPSEMLTCVVDEVLLSAQNSSLGSDFSYEWQGPAGIYSNGTNPQELQVEEAGMYTLVITDMTNSCEATASVSVIQNTTTPTVEAGESLEFGCNDEMLTLSGSASLEADVLNWKNEAGEIIASTMLLDNNINANVFDPGIYILEVMNSETGCIGTDEVIVTVDEDIPTAISTKVEPASCFDEQDAYIEILEVEGGSAPYSFAFDEQAFSSSMLYPYLSAGMYQLTVKDADGCTFEESVFVPETEAITLDIGSDMNLSLGDSEVIHLQTNVPMNEVDTIIWTSTETIECMDDDCMEIKLTPNHTTEVHATLVKDSGCIGEASIRLTVEKPRDVYIPNVFSPNGDGNNDIFYLQGKSELVKVNRFLVFNRWGEVMFDAENFELNDPNVGWDGMLNGKMMNPGVFIYHSELEFVDGKIVLMKGDVTLMR